ncbi:MAG: sugar transferase [Deltaproteobacteria bacterium RBG_13_43_22]|nr:MAG: sugar transferase [Deltaproteobacteria bacterium RBG_13_43_22]
MQSLSSRIIKRCFDLFFSTLGLFATGWLILLAFLAASWDTKRNGFFVQTRVGKNGKPFKVIKIRTMKDSPKFGTTVTINNDPRITRWGRFFRKTKIDELPQLINIFIGDMSFVGPRPDVPGFADRLTGEDRIILSVRPGITGPATLRFRDEEEILARQVNPERYNREVIFSEKVRLNREYVEKYSFWKDIKYICQTIFGK